MDTLIIFLPEFYKNTMIKFKARACLSGMFPSSLILALLLFFLTVMKINTLFKDKWILLCLIWRKKIFFFFSIWLFLKYFRTKFYPAFKTPGILRPSFLNDQGFSMNFSTLYLLSKLTSNQAASFFVCLATVIPAFVIWCDVLERTCLSFYPQSP